MSLTVATYIGYLHSGISLPSPPAILHPCALSLFPVSFQYLVLSQPYQPSWFYSDSYYDAIYLPAYDDMIEQILSRLISLFSFLSYVLLGLSALSSKIFSAFRIWSLLYFFNQTIR